MKKIFLTLALVPYFVFAKATNPQPIDPNVPTFRSGFLCSITHVDENGIINILKDSPWTEMLRIFPVLKKNGKWGERIERNNDIIKHHLEVDQTFAFDVVANESGFGDFLITANETGSGEDFKSTVQNINFMPTKHGQIAFLYPSFKSENLKGVGLECHRN